MIKRVRVVSGLLADADGKVLLQKRLTGEGKRRPGMWETPGGKVEQDEGYETALVREWREELSVDVTVHRRIAHVAFELESPCVISLYHVQLRPGQEPTLNLDVASEMRWVDPLWAVEFLACVPSFYLFQRHIRDFVRRLHQPVEPPVEPSRAHSRRR